MSKRGLLVVLLLAGTAYARRHHSAPVFRAFPPSHQSLIAQNAEIDRLGLQRFQNDKELAAAVERGDLTQIVSGPTLRVSSSLPANRRYCRSWTYDFVSRMAVKFWLRYVQNMAFTASSRNQRAAHRLHHQVRTDAVIKACRAAVAEWELWGAWPDNWSRWQSAIIDITRSSCIKLESL